MKETNRPDDTNTEHGNFFDDFSLLEICRNTFFSALKLTYMGYQPYILTNWTHGEWSIFIGPEDIAKGILLHRSNSLIEAIRWTIFPTRKDWLSKPYSPIQISEWVLKQSSDVTLSSVINQEYKAWLECMVARLATEPDSIPSINYNNGNLTAWIHHRNADMTPKKIPIEQYLIPPPYPSKFKEERLLGGEDGGINGGRSINAGGTPWWSQDAGWTGKGSIPSVGIDDDYQD